MESNSTTMALSPSYSPFDEGADSWSGKDLVEPRDKTTSVASDSDTEAPSEHAARAEELLSESETEEGTKPPSPLHTEPPSPLHGASENEDASSTLSAQEKTKLTRMLWHFSKRSLMPLLARRMTPT